MKKIWVGLWFAVQVCSLWSLDIVNGQAQGWGGSTVVGTVTDNNVTANLITSPLSPTVNATAPGGFSGGSSVGYNATTNTYYFGYTQQTIAKTIAINNALQGSGVQVNGVQYGMSYLNGGDSYGTLSMNVNVTSNTGATLNSYNHSFNTRNNSWQQFDQTQTFASPYALANLGNVSMSITGRDSRFWAGYYGPQVRDPYLKLTYGADPKTYYNIPDDGYAQVNLPFAFPFYGRTFTTSYMFSNGVVGFLDPTTHWNSFCCSGVDLSSNPGSPWNFAIYALQTDLIQANPNAKFWTQGNSSYMKYVWENINEFGTSNLNTFSTTIKPTGYIGIDHQQVNVQNHNVTTGIAGDLSLGQYSQYYTGPGNIFPVPAATLTFTGTEVADLCLANPLSSPTCPNYTAAMCQVNPLYSQSCPGYGQAYFDQQCSANSLYDPNCPGYASAYLDYQCSINPLYATQCSGYAQAYHDQQCSLSPLYATDCTGYAQAYFTQQCSANSLYSVNCPGYAAAYLTQQCNANPLYSTQCSGYAAAYKSQQCSINALYASDCPGYAAAYFSQQCTLNGLYDRTCPNYSEAYAKKMLLEQQNIASTVATAGVVASTAPTTTTATSTPTTTSDGTVSVPVVKDSNVNAVISTTATSASPAQAATATVPLVQAAPAPTAAPQQQTQQEKKPEGGAKPEGGQQQAGGPQPQGGGDGGKEQPKTARQEMMEKRQEAAKKDAVEKGKNLANEMGKAADMESQKQVQNVVIQAMGYTPGFDAYGRAFIPQTVGYKPFTVYNNQKNVDNRRLGMGLYGPSDRLHDELVGSQYKE
jgi:hypothetical protein